jgi:hypothetical protein
MSWVTKKIHLGKGIKGCIPAFRKKYCCRKKQYLHCKFKQPQKTLMDTEKKT